MCKSARENYARVEHRFKFDNQLLLVERAINSALQNHTPKKIPFELTPHALERTLSPSVLSIESLIESIAKVSGQSVEVVSQKVQQERDIEGSTVGGEVRAFDVVPFQNSTQMDDLYRTSTSFPIELAANCNDTARLNMAAFIILRLCTERTRLDRNLKVLAVGDGIGSDSIRLAGAGFDVDYMDYEASATSKVALENFKKFEQTNTKSMGALRVLNRFEVDNQKYDAVISLEVIEHVEKPQDFLNFLNQILVDDGLLFLSDCFSGIKPHWQTHLLANERLSGLTPLMAGLSGFAFNGLNREPFTKPYVFIKSAQQTTQIITSLLQNDMTLELLVEEQSKLIKVKLRKSEKFVNALNKLLSYWRSYKIKKQLQI
jgi:2-polyprenyl-3-methyl-5-hydroxy-6-metoxy-1,4-benzoquinol methylase